MFQNNQAAEWKNGYLAYGIFATQEHPEMTWSAKPKE